jgi:hypothetical protein
MRSLLLSLFAGVAVSQTPRVIRLKVPPDSPVDAISYTTDMLTPDELESVKKHFEDMPVDPYLKTVSRTRKFGKYMIDSLHQSELPIETAYKGNVFIQTGTYNDLVRDGKMAVVRQYHEHDPSFLQSAGVQRALQHCIRSMVLMGANADVPWELGIHAVRLTAPGEVTPEGVHRDGYHYVLSTIISRVGVTGGHSLVHTGKKEKPLLDVPMSAGDSLLINDRAVFHSVSNVTAAPGYSVGHRDVVLITARPWPTNKAGELIDDVANAQLALLEGTIEVPNPEQAKSVWRILRERVGRALALRAHKD